MRAAYDTGVSLAASGGPHEAGARPEIQRADGANDPAAGICGCGGRPENRLGQRAGNGEAAAPTPGAHPMTMRSATAVAVGAGL
jgi:hypothetical protein